MGFRDFIYRELFHPGIVSVFINPFFFARRGLVVQMREFAPRLSGGKLIDIGCGRKPYRELFPGTDYVGLEIDTPATRARGIAERFYDGNTFPCGDAEFDAALANQVLEHVFEPEAFLAEIHRILKPGGKLLLTVPFIWDEHEQPYDYARYSSFGIRYLLEKSGFTVLEAKKTLSHFAAIIQLVNAYFYKALLSRHVILKIIGTLLIVFPMNLFGLLISLLLPQNSDLYLDNIVLAERRP
jgi:SAM-dependent methyltransferase